MNSSDAKRADIKRVPDVADDRIASPLVNEFRDLTPESRILAVPLNGANPAALYSMATSNAIPQDHCYHVREIIHQCNIYDPSRGYPTAILAQAIIMADMEPIHASFLQIEGMLRDALGLINMHIALRRIYPVNYYISHGTVISTFMFADYAGGAAGPPATTMLHTTTILGELLPEPTPMARGTGQTVAANAVTFAQTLAKYGNW